MKIFLAIILFSISLQSIACLNLSGTNIDGEFSNDMLMLPHLSEPTFYPSKSSIYNDLSKLFENTDDLIPGDNFYTDVAALYIFDGQYQRAINLLNENINDKETNYNFCSNIGVAYELVGQLDSALYWTKKGVELNPESHRKSEWIHIRILEIEIEMQKDPNWLSKHNIFDFELPLDSSFITFPDNLALESFIDELGFQLRERTYFVKPHHQDKLVASLILILADGIAKKYDTHKSKDTYLLAAQYDSTLVETVNMRLAHISRIEEDLGLEHYEYTDANGLTITNDAYKEKHVKSGDYSEVIYSSKMPEKKKEIPWFWIVLSGYFLIFSIIFYKVFKR